MLTKFSPTILHKMKQSIIALLSLLLVPVLLVDGQVRGNTEPRILLQVDEQALGGSDIEEELEPIDGGNVSRVISLVFYMSVSFINERSSHSSLLYWFSFLSGRVVN